jgi:hypothetical protein
MADERTTSSRAKPLLAALACIGIVFAAASSCGEGAVQYTAGGGDGGPIGGGPPVLLPGTDGGRDGGDGGLDGGCVDAGPVTFVVDGCFSNDAGSTLTYLPNGCSVSMTWTPGSCTGTLSGPSDAFDGGCQGAGPAVLPCTGSAFPGSLTCTGGLQPCAIRFCAKQGCAP